MPSVFPVCVPKMVFWLLLNEPGVVPLMKYGSGTVTLFWIWPIARPTVPVTTSDKRRPPLSETPTDFVS